MAENWWEEAPLADQAGGEWWADAPLADQQPAQSGQQIVGGVIMPPAPNADGQWDGAIPSDEYHSLDRRASQALAEIGEPINAFNQAFTNMYTLGGLDEVQGAADAAMTDQSFSEARQAARQRLVEQGEQYPVTTTVAGLAGAIASPAAQAAMRWFPAGAGLKAQVASGAASGAALGGAQGFLEGEGGGVARVRNALYGSAVGAGLGMAIPAIASGFGAAYRGASNALNDWRGSSQIADQIGISRRGGRLLSDVVGMDDPARMRAALSQSGPDAMLADAGPTAQGALDAVIQSPGEGARTALGRIDNRAAQAGQALTDQMDQALGVPQGIDAAQAGIRQSTAGARSAAYDAAYNSPIDYASDAGMRLEGLLKRVPDSAIRRANELMAIEGVQSRQIMAQIGDDGAVTFSRMPDVRQLDYITRGLNDVAEAANGQGRMGGTTDIGRAVQGLSRDIRRSVGEAVPAYNDALAAGGDTIRRVQAVDVGAEMLRPGVTRERFASSLQGMDSGELAAVKQGLRQQIDDVMANVRAVASDPNVDAREVYKAYTEMSSRSAREKMEMLLGGEWPALRDQLDNAGRALGLRARVATNSRTFGRQQFGQMIDDSVQPGRIASGEAFGPFASPRAIWQNMTGSTPAAIQRTSAAVKNELADVLTRPGAVNMLAGIEAIRAAHAPSAMAGRGLTNALNGLGLSSLPMSGNELRNRLSR